jgi:excisionase family DNA binding protein
MSIGKQAPLAMPRKEAARTLGVSLSTVDRAIKRGDIKTKKYGTRVLVPMSEIERFARPDDPSDQAATRTSFAGSGSQ